MYRLIALQPHIHRCMALLSVTIALGVFVYGFLLLEAVGHTASRTAIEKEIRHSSSALAALEERYLRQTREVTLEKAAALGFVKPIETTVVFMNAARSLSLNAGR